MTQFKSLSELFAAEKAERIAKHTKPQPQPEPVEKTSKPEKATPSQAKPERSEKTTEGAQSMGKQKKLRASKNITTTHWYNDPASYNQTTRLKNETGKVIGQPNLKTWGIGLTKFEASELISMCADGEAEMAREALIDQHDAEIWEGKPKTKVASKPKAKPAKKAKTAPVDPEAVEPDPPEEDYESIIAKLKLKNRGLKAANTRMKKTREEEAA